MTSQSISDRATELFKLTERQRYVYTDRIFLVLMIVQWIGGIAAAYLIAPRTWIGEESLVHVHVWAAVVMGGLISGMPVLLVWLMPGRTLTRHVVAISQGLWSALLIHLTGGRIETHFHIFGSLAFIAFYRDWRVLLTMATVVTLDHVARGTLWPLSVYGVQFANPFRWVEHAAWVVFELVILLVGCQRAGMASRTLCEHQATLEATNVRIEEQVKERSAELQDAKEFFQSVLDSMQAHICVLDRQGAIVGTNAAWEQFAAQAQSALSVGVGSNYLEICRKAQGDCAAGANAVADAIEDVVAGTREHYIDEYPCHSPEQESWFEVNVTPLQEHTRGSVVVAHSDVTDRVIAQNKLERASQELQAAARAAGKAEVASSVLHNVGNVMNSLNVSVQMLADRLQQSPTDRLQRVSEILEAQSDLGHFLNTDPRGKLLPQTINQLALRLEQDRQSELEELECVLDRVDHVKNIIKKQQSLATHNQCLLEELRIEALVEDALQMNKLLEKKHGVQIRREFEEGLVPVQTDKHRVLQILVNLITNATQAVSQLPNGEVTLRIEQGEESVRVQVVDNGIGIPSDNLKKIFQYGFTTKPTGHGFGLHSCALEAKTLGGSLSVASDGENQGAVFTLQLPMAPLSTALEENH